MPSIPKKIAQLPRSGAETVMYAVAVLAAVAFTALVFGLPNLPFQDLPNHAARGVAMADLLFDGGALFGDLFDLRLAPQPYLLGDMLLAALTQISPALAPRTLAWLSVIALPAVAWPFAGSLGLSRWGQAAAALAAAFAATTLTFTMGYINFQLGVALLVATLLFALRLLNGSSRWHALSYFVSVGAGFLMHLSVPVLLVPLSMTMVAVAWLQTARREPFPWARAAWIIAVPVALLAVDRLLGAHDAGAFHWLSSRRKLAEALRQYDRLVGQWPDGRSLLVLFAAVPLFALLTGGWRLPRVQLLAAITTALVALYFGLPSSQGGVFSIDMRALPPACFFAALTGIASVDSLAVSARWRIGATATVVALTVLNLVALWAPLRGLDHTMGEVRQALAALPEGATLLPVRTADSRYSHMTLHAAEFAVLDRKAFTPYLFSGDQDLPQKHFRYRDRPYAPHELWVHLKRSIDWKQVRETYPYVLVVGPEMGVEIPYPVERVSGNPSATLLRFVR